MADAVDKVGLGVDLLGGDATLSLLKAIRAEMTGIAALGKGVGGNAFGPSKAEESRSEQFIKAREKAEIDSIKRVQTAKAKAMQYIDLDEPATLNATLARKREVQRRANLLNQQEMLQAGQLNSRINERGAKEVEARQEKEARGYARLRQILEVNSRKNREDIVREGQLREEQERKYLAMRKATARELASDPNAFAGRDPSLRGRLRSVRNDSFSRSDPTTQGFRNDTALELRALRLKRDTQRQFDTEQLRDTEALSARLNAIDERRSAGAIQRAKYQAQKQSEVLRQNFVNTSPDLNSQLDLANRLLGVSSPSKNGRGGGTGNRNATNLVQTADVSLSNDARAAQVQFNTIAKRAQSLRDELLDVNRTRPIREVASDLRQLEAQSDKALLSLKQLRRANESIPNSQRQSLSGLSNGGGGGGGRGPRTPQGGGQNDPSLKLRDPQGLFNEKGFFTTGDALGRITRNILLYEVVSRATYGLATYIQQSILAAKATVEYSNALRFATEQAGGNIGQNERLANSLQVVGLSRQQGRQAVTEAARFAINRPDDTEALTRTATNIAASRGIGVDKSDELIEQLRRRESKFYKRIFGTTVESIYADFAAERVDSNTTPRRGQSAGLFVGDNGPIKSRQADIKSYIEQMDDAQKETAVFNYILNQSGRFQGEAAERATTLAGRIDKINAAFLNAQEGAGLFITELKPVNDLIDLLVGKLGVLDKLSPPQIGRSGSGGSITADDARQFSIDKTTGFRANAINEINTLGNTALVGAGALGLTALLGRGQAKENVRSGEYKKLYDGFYKEFNGNAVAAQNEAARVAREAKPGLLRSVGEGVKRLTFGVNDSVSNFTGVPNARNFNTNLPTYSQFSPQARQLNLGQSFALPGTFGASQNAPNIVQGAFSPLLGKNDLRDFSRLQSFGGATGGITGGVLGATLGSLVADKLNVGPITATGLTIAGGIAGTTIGTTIGTVIATSITTAIASAGGFGAIAGTAGGAGGLLGVGTAGVGTLAGAGALGVGAIVGGVLAALGVGGAIGAGINYLNPNDALSQEQRRIDRDKAFGEADTIRRRELTNNELEGKVRYRDLKPGSDTFGKLFSEREARQLGGFERGFGTGALKIEAGESEEAFRTRVANSDPRLTRRFEQLTLQGNDPRLQVKDQQEITRQTLDAEAKLNTSFRNRAEVEERLSELRRKDQTLPENAGVAAEVKNLESQLVLYQKINALRDKSQLLAEYGTTDEKQIKFLDDYRARSAESERKRKEKEKADRDKDIQEQTLALSKLRDASAGSFKIVGDIGGALTGPDNQFTKVLADQITSAERMKQQWGFLGDAAVKYFDTLEQKALSRQLNALEFGSFTTSTNLLTKARNEKDARTDPGLSRKDQDYLNIQQAIVDKAVQIPKLWAQAAEVLGQTVNPIKQLQGRIKALQLSTGSGAAYSENRSIAGITYGGTINDKGEREGGTTQLLNPQSNGRIEGFNPGQQQSTLIGPDGKQTSFTLNAGQSDDYATYRQQALARIGESPEVRRRSQEQYADAALSILSEYDPQQIRQSGLGQVYAGAIRIKAQGLDGKIEEARQKAEIGSREDVRLATQLKDDEAFRAKQIDAGRDPKDVGRESDRLLLARTEGIAPKDLSLDQFSTRQDALRRDAERSVQDQAEAKLAVATGLEHQDNLLKEVRALRKEILSGSISALIQIQNDTQARVDKTALEATSNGNVPLDQRSVKSSAYTPSTEKYKSLGGKYGLTNR